jgi:hypothetical protein
MTDSHWGSFAIAFALSRVAKSAKPATHHLELAPSRL